MASSGPSSRFRGSTLRPQAGRRRGPPQTVRRGPPHLERVDLDPLVGLRHVLFHDRRVRLAGHEFHAGGRHANFRRAALRLLDDLDLGPRRGPAIAGGHPEGRGCGQAGQQGRVPLDGLGTLDGHAQPRDVARQGQFLFAAAGGEVQLQRLPPAHHELHLCGTENEPHIGAGDDLDLRLRRRGGLRMADLDDRFSRLQSAVSPAQGFDGQGLGVRAFESGPVDRQVPGVLSLDGRPETPFIIDGDHGAVAVELQRELAVDGFQFHGVRLAPLARRPHGNRTAAGLAGPHATAGRIKIQSVDACRLHLPLHPLGGQFHAAAVSVLRPGDKLHRSAHGQADRPRRSEFQAERRGRER